MTILVTKRLMLKPMEATDEAIRKQVTWLNDPEVTRYSEQRHKKHNFETQRSYLGHFLHRPDRIREIYYRMEMIGTITAYIDQPNSIANVGIMIGEKSAWGRGLGTEAWQAFCDLLLNTGVRKVEAGCMGINYGMIKIFRNTGMIEEGRRFDHFLVSNELSDMVQFGRFR